MGDTTATIFRNAIYPRRKEGLELVFVSVHRRVKEMSWKSHSFKY